ncbi:MAG: radical SAM protein [Bacilli bacterium]|nr:radical SAM protein [Bacilli bacterium]
MKKRFKKIYVEITNRCNLKCSFCGSSKLPFKSMSIDEFEYVVKKIKPFTDYIYLHVKGEPLLYTELDKALLICDRENIKVNITTNGTLLKEKYDILNKHTSIRQINISLHSENDYPNYFKNVFFACKLLSTKMFISYRIWTLNNYKLNKKSTDIVNKIIEYYKLDQEIVEKLKNENSIKIDNNTFVNKENLFIWPDDYTGYPIDSFCYGLDSHIGILSNGTVVPCCLDSTGEINLGNIFNEELSDILDKELVRNIIDSFKNNKSYCNLCKKCNFRNRFLKK